MAEEQQFQAGVNTHENVIFSFYGGASNTGITSALACLEAVKELGLERKIDVSELKDIQAISSRGVFLTPGVVIDDVKVCEGRIPSSEEIKKWINETK